MTASTSAVRPHPEPRRPPDAVPERYGWPAVLLLFLLPGLASALWILAAGPVFERFGLPGSLGVSVTPVVIAAQLGWLLWLGRRRNGRLSLAGVVGFRRRLPWPRLVAVVAGLYLAVLVLYLALAPVTALLADHVFGWLPEAFSGDASDAPHGVLPLVLLLVGNFAFNGVAAPWIEELFWRGHVLPRMPVAGAAAILVNAALFSLQHFWQPELYLLVFLAQVLMQAVLVRFGDLRTSIAVHCAVNLTGGVLTLTTYLSAWP